MIISTQSAAPMDFVITDGDEVHTVSAADLSAALEECEIDLSGRDYTENQKEGTVYVTVTPLPTVTVMCDGTISVVEANDLTVSSVLDKLNITLGDDDTVSEELDAAITDGMKIVVKRISVTYNSVDTVISHETEYVENSSLYKGSSNIVTEGSDGLLRTTYVSTKISGVTQSMEVFSEDVIKEPVTTVIEYGTKEKPAAAASSSTSKVSSSSNKTSSSASASASTTGTEAQTVLSQSGKSYSYSKVLEMTATAYTYVEGHHNITYSGKPAQVGIVAALQSTLPQGTRVYIVAADGSWEYGEAVVGDVPGRDIIDLFMETYDECIQFGVRDALVYVLK